MGEAEKSPRLTCGSMALAGVLALIVVIALYRQPRPPTWPSMGAAAIGVVSVFLIGRGMLTFVGGLAAAALLTFHPVWFVLGAKNELGDAIHPQQKVLAAACVLACVAGTRVGWQLTFHPVFAWRVWHTLIGARAARTGLAWIGDKYLGLLALALIISGMLAAACLACSLRRREGKVLPSRLNVMAGMASVAAVPVAALVVFLFLNHSLSSEKSFGELLPDAF